MRVSLIIKKTFFVVQIFRNHFGSLYVILTLGVLCQR